MVWSRRGSWISKLNENHKRSLLCCIIFAERIYDKHIKNASIVTRHGLVMVWLWQKWHGRYTHVCQWQERMGKWYKGRGYRRGRRADGTFVFRGESLKIIWKTLQVILPIPLPQALLNLAHLITSQKLKPLKLYEDINLTSVLHQAIIVSARVRDKIPRSCLLCTIV